MITQYRYVCLNIFINSFCYRRRKVYTAMGTVFLIDGPAETGPPVSIMHPDISVKWHPVCNRRIIVLALQHRVALLIGQFIGASRGTPALRLISGYKIRFNQQLPILIIEQMLGSPGRRGWPLSGRRPAPAPDFHRI